MKKLEFIERYGEEAWERKKSLSREWSRRHRVKREKHRDKQQEEHHQYYLLNKEKFLYRYLREKIEPKGRARHLLNRYKSSDRIHNRGECTITVDWILNNVFNGVCAYCGETNWTKLGVDRIDNSKPHTPENCVCACWDCNNERGRRYTFEEFVELKKQNSR